MLTPLHRLMTHLLHRYGDSHPYQALSTFQQGIPDGYMDKLPPSGERAHTRDPRTRQSTETQALQGHAA